MQKIIIIRGPSGSGKSTVAQKLLDATSDPILLVSEDKVRRNFNDWKRSAHEESKQLAMDNILFGLNNGYHVVYEGILNIKTYAERFNKLFEIHPDENYLFYLNVSFDETQRRHLTRTQKEEFGRKEMERWWDYASPSGFSGEVIMPESSTAEQVVAKICEVAKFVH